MPFRSKKKHAGLFTTCYNLFLLVSMFLIEGGFSTYPLSAAQSGESRGTGVGSWIPLEFGAKTEGIGGGADKPEARTEAGGTVIRLRGSMKVKAATTLKAGETVAVLPVATPGIRPAANFRDSVGISAPPATRTYTVADFEILANGEIKYQATAELVAESVIILDGITFYVS